MDNFSLLILVDSNLLTLYFTVRNIFLRICHLENLASRQQAPHFQHGGIGGNDVKGFCRWVCSRAIWTAFPDRAPQLTKNAPFLLSPPGCIASVGHVIEAIAADNKGPPD